MSEPAPSPASTGPARLALASVFAQAGLVGFGGAMPVVRRLIVERHGWLSEADFTDLVGLSQALPGALVVNLAVAIGRRFHGAPGAVLAVLSLLGPALGAVVLMALLAERFGDMPAMRNFLAGVAAAAAGLFLVTALRMLRPHLRHPVACLVAGLGFLALFVLKLPLLAVLALLVPVSLLLQRTIRR